MFAIPRFLLEPDHDDTSRTGVLCKIALFCRGDPPMLERNCPGFPPANEQLRSAISIGLSHHTGRDEYLLSLFQVPELSQPI